MDPATAAIMTTATTLLTPLIGARTAAVVSIIGLICIVVSAFGHVMARLPVADASSPRWYRNIYGVLALATGNYGRNAPVPPSGQLAGAPVPVPKP